MTASGLISIQSHTYDMHQWPPYETGSAVRENILQLSSESEEAYVQALTEDFTRSRALLEDATGRPVDVLAYPAGQYSTLAQVTLQSLGVHVTLSTNPGVNTVVKGLPQTLYAMLRFGITEDESNGVLEHLITGGDFSLYGLANAVTRFSQDVESYDRATKLEEIGYSVMTMSPALFRQMNQTELLAA